MHEIRDLVPIARQPDVRSIGIAEQVVQVAEDLLIGTSEENAEQVRIAIAPLVQLE